MSRKSSVDGLPCDTISHHIIPTERAGALSVWVQGDLSLAQKVCNCFEENIYRYLTVLISFPSLNPSPSSKFNFLIKIFREIAISRSFHGKKLKSGRPSFQLLLKGLVIIQVQSGNGVINRLVLCLKCMELAC